MMRKAGGFSLLELIAVLAIFAVVALIGVQVIQASVRSSERLTTLSDETSKLAYALAVLRHDLNAALPRRFTPPDGGTEPALVSRAGGFSLSVGGLARLDPGATGFGRVIWRFNRRDGTLLRQVWTTLTPGGSAPPEVLVLDGIDAFDLASFTLEGGWRDGFAADPRNTAALPMGLRIRLTHRRADALETIVSLR